MKIRCIAVNPHLQNAEAEIKRGFLGIKIVLNRVALYLLLTPIIWSCVAPRSTYKDSWREGTLNS